MKRPPHLHRLPLLLPLLLAPLRCLHRCRPSHCLRSGAGVAGAWTGALPLLLLILLLLHPVL